MKTFGRAVFITIAVTLLGTGIASATDYTWTGGGLGDTNWSQTSNWNPSSGYPVSTSDSAVIGSGGAQATMNTSGVATSLTFSRGADFTINGSSTLILYGGGINVTDNKNYTISAPLQLSASNMSFTNTSGGTLTVGAISTQLYQLNWNTSSASDSITGIISSSSSNGSLTKSGAGTLTLSGNNTYQGATTIVDGYLSISQDANLGTAPGSATADHLVFAASTTYPTLVITENMTLNANRGMTLNNTGGEAIQVESGKTATYNGIIAGPGGGSGSDFSKWGDGTLVLGGVNTYAGDTYVDSGILAITGTTANSTMLVYGGTLAGTGTIGSVTVGYWDGGSTVTPGTIAPGVGSTGTFTTGDMLLNRTSTYAWEVNGASCDLLQINGTLDITALGTGAGETFNISVTGAPGSSTNWILADFTSLFGAFDASKFTVDNQTGAGLFSLSYDAGNTRFEMNYSAVPEPSSVAFFGIGLIGIGGLLRKKIRGS